jgi:hypothetical protein
LTLSSKTDWTLLHPKTAVHVDLPTPVCVYHCKMLRHFYLWPSIIGCIPRGNHSIFSSARNFRSPPSTHHDVQRSRARVHPKRYGLLCRRHVSSDEELYLEQDKPAYLRVPVFDSLNTTYVALMHRHPAVAPLEFPIEYQPRQSD